MTYTPQTLTEVSIHAPHEGERRFKVPRLGGMAAFQSTLPTRGSDEIIKPKEG